MNRDELEAKLAAQRKWREAPLPAATKQRKLRFSLFIVIVTAFSGFMIVVIAAGLYAWAAKGIEAVPTSTLVTVDEPATTIRVIMVAETVSTTAPIIMRVCAGIPTAKLHVRITPNGDVRGYLNEGEQVKLSLDEKGKPITTSNQSWTQIDSPINGWVNTSFICK